MARYRCQICMKRVQAKVAPGGDGSELRAQRHKTTFGNPCDGHLYKPVVTGTATQTNSEATSDDR